MENTCVCCGEIIPEGRQICPVCIKQLKEYQVEGAKTISVKKFVVKGSDNEQRAD